jgi:hypothetical protein
MRQHVSKMLYPLLFLVLCGVIRVLPEIGLQYYDEGTDSYYQCAISGLFTGSPEHLPAAWGKWTFLSHLHQFLYTILPQFNWYSIILLLLTAWTAMLMLDAVRLKWSEQNGKNPWGLERGVLALLTLMFVENLMLIQFTRIATFLCLFGILHILLRLHKTGFAHKWIWLNGLLAFSIGAMIRLEPALLCIGMLLPLMLLWIRKRELPFRSLGLLLLPLSLSFVISILINTPATQSDRLTVLHNRFLHNTDGVKYRTDQLNIATKTDSLAYSMTFRYFLNDPKHINQEFADRIALKAFMNTQTIGDHIKGVDRFVKRLQQTWSNYVVIHQGLAAVFLVVAMSVHFRQGVELRKFPWDHLLLTIVYLCYFVVIAGYMKMDHHVFVPLVFSMSLLLLISMGEMKVNRSWTGILLAVAVIGVAHEAMYVSKELKNKRIESRLLESYFSAAAQMDARFIVFDLRSIFRAYMRPFQELGLNPVSKLISIDNGLIFVLPTYGDKLLTVIGSKELEDVWGFLTENQHKVIFLAKGERLKVVCDYFNRQYGLNMEVTPARSGLENVYSNKLEVKHDLGVFRVRNAEDFPAHL